MSETANPFLARIAKKNIGDHGRVSEKRVAAKLSMRPTPGSGNMHGAKGDSKGKAGGLKLLAESKCTTGVTLAVQHTWLAKIQQEASDVAAVPLLTMSFVTPEGKSKPDGDWVAMPLHAWQEILERLGES